MVPSIAETDRRPPALRRRSRDRHWHADHREPSAAGVSAAPRSARPGRLITKAQTPAPFGAPRPSGGARPDRDRHDEPEIGAGGERSATGGPDRRQALAGRVGRQFGSVGDITRARSPDQIVAHQPRLAVGCGPKDDPDRATAGARMYLSRADDPVATEEVGLARSTGDRQMDGDRRRLRIASRPETN